MVIVLEMTSRPFERERERKARLAVNARDMDDSTEIAANGGTFN